MIYRLSKPKPVRALAHDSKTNRLFTLENESLTAWDFETAKPLMQLPLPFKACKLILAKDSLFIGGVCQSKLIHVFNTDFKRKDPISTDFTRVSSMVYEQKTERIAVGGDAGKLMLIKKEGPVSLYSSKGKVCAVAFDSSAQRLLAATQEGAVTVFSADKNFFLVRKTFEEKLYSLTSLMGEIMLVGGRFNMFIFDVGTGEIKRRFRITKCSLNDPLGLDIHRHRVKAIIALPDKKTVYTASGDKTINKLNLETGELQQVYEVGYGFTSMIYTEPSLLVAGSVDGSAHLLLAANKGPRLFAELEAKKKQSLAKTKIKSTRMNYPCFVIEQLSEGRFIRCRKLEGLYYGRAVIVSQKCILKGMMIKGELRKENVKMSMIETKIRCSGPLAGKHEDPFLDIIPKKTRITQAVLKQMMVKSRAEDPERSEIIVHEKFESFMSNGREIPMIPLNNNTIISEEDGKFLQQLNDSSIFENC